jgi:hypothetical protein
VYAVLTVIGRRRAAAASAAPSALPVWERDESSRQPARGGHFAVPPTR